MLPKKQRKTAPNLRARRLCSVGRSHAGPLVLRLWRQVAPKKAPPRPLFRHKHQRQQLAIPQHLGRQLLVLVALDHGRDLLQLGPLRVPHHVPKGAELVACADARCAGRRALRNLIDDGKSCRSFGGRVGRCGGARHGGLSGCVARRRRRLGLPCQRVKLMHVGLDARCDGLVVVVQHGQAMPVRAHLEDVHVGEGESLAVHQRPLEPGHPRRGQPRRPLCDLLLHCLTLRHQCADARLQLVHLGKSVRVYVCVCVCVCAFVCVRLCLCLCEREREREGVS
mmetsp:Transcript_36769/g.92923  ORF Transcript_36769/g.92923 Transcript_36769/m.92923 type:complete len:281 (+) Transcript_36769:281-1123(+)